MSEEYKIRLGVDIDTSDIKSQLQNSKIPPIELDAKLSDKSINAIKTQLTSLTNNTYRVNVDIDNSQLSKQIDQAKSELRNLNKTSGGKKVEPISIDANSIVRNAQQVGQKTADAMEKSFKQSFNIDSVIDKQVSSLMKKHGIAGKKGSKAFNEIREAIVKFRTESSKSGSAVSDLWEQGIVDPDSIKRVSSAIASNIKVVDESKKSYKDLLEYIKEVNKSGTKIHLQDEIKQEFGDGFSKMRSRLGKAFTTGDGIGFDSWIMELNEVVGHVVDLDKALPDVFGDLVRIVDDAKSGGKYLSEKDLFGFGHLDEFDLDRDIEEAFFEIDRAEMQMAQRAQQSTNEFVQAEERKQQAIRETSQEIHRLQGNSKNIINVNDFADTGLDGTVNHIANLQSALKNFGFNDSAIDEIIKDFKNLNVEVKDLQTTLQGNTLKIDVKGFDQYKRLVNTSGSFAPDDDGNLTSGGFRTSVKQTFKVASEEAKQFSNDLLSIGNKMGNLQEKISKLEFKGGSSNEISVLKKELKELEKEYQNVEKDMNDAGVKLSATQDNAIKTQFKNTENNLKEIEASYKDTRANLAKDIKLRLDTGDFDRDISNVTTKAKELGQLPKSLKNNITQLKRSTTEMNTALANGDTDKAIKAYDRFEQKLKTINNQLKISKNDKIKVDADFGKLKDLGSEIDRLSKKIIKIDPKINTDEFNLLSRELKDAETSFNRLKSRLSEKLSAGQLDSLTADAIKAKKELEELQAKVTDAKRNLANGIKIKLDNDISFQVDKIENDINGLSSASTELKQKFDKLKNIKLDMDIASDKNDVEELIRLYDKYKITLKEVESQLKKNVNIEKLNQSKDALSSKMDTWLAKNSAAAKQFGVAIEMLQQELKEASNSFEVGKISNRFKQLTAEAQKAGVATQSFGDRLKKEFAKYSSYFSIATVFSYGEMAIQDMFQQVVAIDSAMTELKKVTDETDETYSRFLSNASGRAQEIGTTIDGLVESTANFARLGYNFNDSQGLAEVANVYAVVGDEIEGVEGATKSLISTMSAYKSQMGDMSNTDFAMDIVDKFNEVS